ncbi:hypothetical protein [Actinophytocola sp.]|uniref:hypothetical protein n=1 Tax=Actinophytocola sp. TaxID=1872138 RepID=UPI003899E511
MILIVHASTIWGEPHWYDLQGRGERGEEAAEGGRAEEDRGVGVDDCVAWHGRFHADRRGPAVVACCGDLDPQHADHRREAGDDARRLRQDDGHQGRRPGEGHHR